MTILNEIIDRRAVQRLDKNTGEWLDQEFIASEKSYKTGDKENRHHTQIRKYANALKNMGYKVLATDLIYTQDILK